MPALATLTGLCRRAKSVLIGCLAAQSALVSQWHLSFNVRSIGWNYALEHHTTLCVQADPRVDRLDHVQDVRY